jgi:hypothetical protein
MIIFLVKCFVVKNNFMAYLTYILDIAQSKKFGLRQSLGIEQIVFRIE